MAMCSMSLLKFLTLHHTPEVGFCTPLGASVSASAFQIPFWDQVSKNLCLEMPNMKVPKPPVGSNLQPKPA